MTDPMPDAYSEESLKLQTGDKSKTLVYRTSEDGGVEAVLKDKTDPLRLSAAHRRAVRESPDGAIQERHRNDSGTKIYFSIGTVKPVTVIWYSGEKYNCLTCGHQRTDCAHVKRIALFRERAA